MIKTTYDTIILTRLFNVAVQKVFSAWEDTAALETWCCPGDNGWHGHVDAHAFEIGGRKQITFGPAGGIPYHENTVYLDIVKDQRIVSAEIISQGGHPIAASLVTLEFEAVSGGCQMMIRDQITQIDPRETTEARRGGLAEVLGKLESYLMSGARGSARAH